MLFRRRTTTKEPGTSAIRASGSDQLVTDDTPQRPMAAVCDQIRGRSGSASRAAQSNTYGLVRVPAMTYHEVAPTCRCW